MRAVCYLREIRGRKSIKNQCATGSVLLLSNEQVGRFEKESFVFNSERKVRAVKTGRLLVG